MTENAKKLVIIGAGPCGLGAAWRLHELGFDNYQLFEKNDYVGGLSASFADAQGFTWDIGGHIQFSHYDYFDRLMEAVIPEAGWVRHQRESWIWLRERFIPYPLQYNIGKLPRREMLECLEGLQRCGKESAPNANFLDWIIHTFGEGIARHFLIPYNEKVWAYPLEQLSSQWTGERVAVPDVKRVMENITQGREDRSWGPNNTFKFPLRGGTGAIWRALAGGLPEGKIHLSSELTAVHPDRKRLQFRDGREEEYDYLISTMPLDQLLHLIDGAGREARDRFVYSSINTVGVGLAGEPPEKLRTMCWMYFPEDDNPFYRVTVFSNYSPHNVPPGSHWSLMGEIAESPHKQVAPDRLLDEALEGFYNTRLIEKNASIASLWTHRAAYAYPTPFIGRDALVDPSLEALQKKQIYSRGRFGAWKYECGNMDHAVMQGVEAVDHILFGTPELTLTSPSLVNACRVR